MKRILLIFFVFTIYSSISFAQKEKYQSLFIYNFTKYIKWPESYNGEKFVIGVIGNSEILAALNEMAASKKKTGTGEVIEVKKYSSVDNIDNCNILFVSNDAVDNLGKIVDQTSSKPILIITESPGMATKGSIINFVDQNGKIKFELNEAKATTRGLVVSGSLTSLAIMI